MFRSLLLRASDDAKLQSRIENEVFGSSLFGPLKAQYPRQTDFRKQIMSKVVPVRGDLQKEHLGLSDQDRAMVQADTSLVISCGAHVGLFLPLLEAVNVSLK